MGWRKSQDKHKNGKYPGKFTAFKIQKLSTFPLCFDLYVSDKCFMFHEQHVHHTVQEIVLRIFSFIMKVNAEMRASINAYINLNP